MINLSRQLLLVWLLAVSLLSVQLIQQSGLHDHSEHFVDCALCHFDSFDHQLPGIVKSSLQEAGAPEQIFIRQSAYLSLQYSPYLGRSPPQFLI
jgi:hypothetical protein